VGTVSKSFRYGKELRTHRCRLIFRDDPRREALLAHFGDDMRTRTDVRAVIVVTAERISESCGFAVPWLDFRGERALHAEHFRREDDESSNDYYPAKPHVATSLDGLPWLPLPLPPLPVTSP
jgi:hypothetical protein